MKFALALAANGRGTASPNPMVGAVVVNDGRIVGKGYHLRPGHSHAEILALKAAGPRARGGALFVTLEPCCHLNKRTPPCVPAILWAGVTRVVIAQRDPNPLVNGKSVRALRRAGLSVAVGVGRSEAIELNRAYNHYMRTRRPYVLLKAGMTLDGQIATASGEGKWITSAPSRADVHRLRSQVDAVLVGIGTVMIDDPSLTARVGPRLKKLAAEQPLRVVVDSRLRIPLTARILKRQHAAKTLIATTRNASASARRVLAKVGVEVVTVPSLRGRVSLPALLRELGRRGVTSLLVEGGGDINAAMLRAKLVQHVRLYMAPALLGGSNAKGMIGGESPARLADTLKLKHVRTGLLGGDILVEGDL